MSTDDGTVSVTSPTTSRRASSSSRPPPRPRGDHPGRQAAVPGDRCRHLPAEFTATNFTLDDPPVGFPDGDPEWLTLNCGSTTTQFTIETVNSGLLQNQTGKFLIHKSDGAVVDPTVVNNPIGTMEPKIAPQHRSAQARAWERRPWLPPGDGPVLAQIDGTKLTLSILGPRSKR